MFKRVLLFLCCFGHLSAKQTPSTDGVAFEQDSQIVLEYVVGVLDGSASKEAAVLNWREMTKNMTAAQKQQLVKKAIADIAKPQNVIEVSVGVSNSVLYLVFGVVLTIAAILAIKHHYEAITEEGHMNTFIKNRIYTRRFSLENTEVNYNGQRILRGTDYKVYPCFDDYYLLPPFPR